MNTYQQSSIKTSEAPQIAHEGEHPDEILVPIILSSSYTEEQVRQHLELIESVIRSPVTHESIVNLARTLGRRIEKLRLYKSDDTQYALRHLYGTYILALSMIETGHLVHLIESVNTHGIKQLGDIDLFVTCAGKIHLYDFTHVKGVTNHHMDGYSDKYEVLKNKLNGIDYESHVTSISLPDFCYNIEIAHESVQTVWFNEEFLRIENLIQVAHTLNSDEVRDMIEDYSNKVALLA